MVAIGDAVFSADWTSSCIVDLQLICRSLSRDTGVCKPRDLLSVMYAESGCRADAHNPNGHASGLNQCMPDTLDGLGFHPELPPVERAARFRELSVKDQLPYVYRYYKPYTGRLDSVAAIYVATFLPAFISQARIGGPDFVLVDKTIGKANGINHAVIYTANAGFDKNGDLKITVGELEMAVMLQCRGDRWMELSRRLGGVETDPVRVSLYDLRTIDGLQRALGLLGIHVAVDGLWGPATRGGVIAFQKRVGLAPDGIYGPRTRAALANAIDGKVGG